MSIGIRLHDVIAGTMEARARNTRAQGFSCAHVALSKVISPARMSPAIAAPGLASYVHSALCGLEPAVLGCYPNLAHPVVREDRRIRDR